MFFSKNDDILCIRGWENTKFFLKGVKNMRKHIGAEVKVKAAGGISSFDDAEKFMSLGADRLGTSRIVKVVKTME